MPRVDIVCLANSYKHGGRCVAGLQVNGAGWIRPVGHIQGGKLCHPEYILDDGSEAQPLDLIKIGVQAHRPQDHQPENWLTDSSPWSLHARPMATSVCPILRNAIINDVELLRGYSDRVALEALQQQPAADSLALIAPDTLDLYHQLNYTGRPQARGRFRLGTGRATALYDLVITDPIWRDRVLQQGPQTLRQADGRFLMTISLGEPLGLDCYKLIAAIIVLPPGLATAL